jgi:hypothetical protein
VKCQEDLVNIDGDDVVCMHGSLHGLAKFCKFTLRFQHLHFDDWS